MVTFVSQCEKNSLKKTRRVLDAFANRIGDNTWQTVITNDGLNTVKKMLRQSASKNTAVSCHWIRSRSRSQFLWVVGNKDKFDGQGIVPVNSTKRKLLNSHIENDWKYLPLIKALTAIAALFHDWGKASQLFQEKLRPESKYKFKGDPIRHEWISTLLLSALIKSVKDDTDTGWLSCLANGDFNEEQLININNEQTSTPLYQLPNAAKLVSWLIVSHHRLPFIKDDWRDESASDIDAVLKRITKEWGYENRQDEQEYQKRIANCFKFPKGLLSQSSDWLKQVKRWSQRLEACLPLIESTMKDGSYRLVLHHARLCLMLGDHYYSSQDADAKWQDTTGLFANTDRKTKQYKQKLDEHLVGVASNALKTAHLLPAFEREPPLTPDIPSLKKISSSTSIYYWQDKAVKQINSWKQSQNKKTQGFFAINMASTGCGKTFANAKIMRILQTDSKSLRYILALGLRTLTLQTGDEYRNRIGLDKSKMAVLIGSKAISELHQQTIVSENNTDNAQSGSESQEALFDEAIDYECDIPEEGLATILTKEKDRQFLYAPVLVCTIDHIMAATETKRGGRYILPSLRLMSSDLVIDEIDDFTGSDLVAIGRLIHLTGMLGRKVMLSSATISPDLAEGYFNAYKKGWQLYSQSRENSEDIIGCAWIDEFKTQVSSINSMKSEDAISDYQTHHSQFISQRVTKLKQQVVKRKAEVVDCQESMEEVEFDSNETKQEQYFSLVREAIITKHQQHHTIDQKKQVAVSFGVVRFANILPCVALTKYLLQADYPEDIEVKVMAYHSQQVLLLRHEQEKHLDVVLKRKENPDEQPDAFNHPVIRAHLDNSTVKNIIFILVATPVEEVGRDHDFDWAVVEPSSYRSIIQLAGRVHRHRDGEVEQCNIALMQYNWKAFKKGDEAGQKYFKQPGYEEKVTLETHDLNQLIDTSIIKSRLDATPRIQKNRKLNEYRSLVDLEHVVTHSELTNYQQLGPEKLQGYLDQTWYLTALPQYLNPFRKSEVSTNLFLTYDPDTESCYFSEKDEDGYPINRENILQISHINFTDIERQNLWLLRDYQLLLSQYSKECEISKKWVSLRYGELNFVNRDDDSEYEYNDNFGLVKITKL